MISLPSNERKVDNGFAFPFKTLLVQWENRPKLQVTINRRHCLYFSPFILTFTLLNFVQHLQAIDMIPNTKWSRSTDCHYVNQLRQQPQSPYVNIPSWTLHNVHFCFLIENRLFQLLSLTRNIKDHSPRLLYVAIKTPKSKWLLIIKNAQTCDARIYGLWTHCQEFNLKNNDKLKIQTRQC